MVKILKLGVFVSVIFQQLLCFGGEIKSSSALKDNTEAINQFEKIVDNYEAFFKASPYLIIKANTYPDHKISFVLHKYLGSNLTYDIQKTDSLISPLAGYIKIDMTNQFDGFEQVRDAINAANQLQTLKSNLPFVAKFVFAFQREKWVLKRIVNEKQTFKDGTEGNLSAGILGLFELDNEFGHMKPVEPELIEFNKGWSELASP